MRKVSTGPLAVAVLVVVVGGVGFGLYWFQLGKLWQDQADHLAFGACQPCAA
ncbi:hypothetical protein ACFY9S_27530 [Streptomyces sp. NPDC012474]|uniref:hypothetical protein n=1 Tax=Streptomyces sp. NPDC012474 TaxID=3364836 RepID=UPI0036F1034D